MCGILGIFTNLLSADLSYRFQSGLIALSHRGPDDRGEWFHQSPHGNLALGQTRLSIIDLSPGGHQPMHSPDGRYTIVFNGEIYNYRELRQELALLGHAFRSSSDTEVLLAGWAQWGKSCLSRLRGMFAFTVFDRIEQTLICVRDAFGIKPFYYVAGEGCFLFASEVPALLALLPNPPPLNLQRAYDYLVFGGYDDQEATFFDGIRHLLPGHLLTLQLSKASAPVIERWWWPAITEHTDLSFADAADQLRSMFLDNIRLHLRSDVPLGTALSGGVDSSAVVCAIRYLEPEMPIHTFSYVARGSEVDEERWADQVNDHVGAIPHKVVVSPEELADDLDDMIHAQGEPFGSTSIYAQFRVFKLARDHGVTVTLDGQGADELLAGYNGYPSPRMRSLLEKRLLVELIQFLRAWSAWPGRTTSQGVKGLIEPWVPVSLRGLAYRVIGRNPAPAWLVTAFFQEHGVALTPPLKPGSLTDETGRRLVAALRHALTGQGLNALLRHGDRNSMRWSVESRVPFLTTDMAEFLLSLPESYLISPQGETKHIFRAAMRGIVPDIILDRKDKIGFATPEQAWLKQLGNTIFDWLDAAEALPFLNAAQCRRKVKMIIEGHRYFDFQAWRLINFCRWAQIMNV